ncbi:MAG: hypothetical protein JSV51_04255 [Candidatus Bathyarchaeota archaeon]|nr:MAG: hypothetical protein JSV51_04255 [Candidatus Bathyarchaeota archaeon]
MEQDEWKEWKEGYRESIREWKQRYRKALQEWRNRYHEWKSQSRPRGSFPLMPPMPPMPPSQSMSTGRTNVVASRLTREDLQIVDMLIEASVFTTRSEAVAYLVNEGIKARQDVLDKVSSSLREIRGIREKAEEQVEKLKEEIGLAGSQVEEIKEEIEEPEKKERHCPKCDKDISDLPKDIALCPYCGVKFEE